MLCLPHFPPPLIHSPIHPNRSQPFLHSCQILNSTSRVIGCVHHGFLVHLPTISSTHQSPWQVSAILHSHQSSPRSRGIVCVCHVLFVPISPAISSTHPIHPGSLTIPLLLKSSLASILAWMLCPIFTNTLFATPLKSLHNALAHQIMVIIVFGCSLM